MVTAMPAPSGRSTQARSQSFADVKSLNSCLTLSFSSSGGFTTHNAKKSHASTSFLRGKTRQPWTVESKKRTVFEQ